MVEPAITAELVKKHNLTPDEYERVKQILGREPSYTELGIFSVMWSEHCSYKNTRPVLKLFPTKSPSSLNHWVVMCSACAICPTTATVGVGSIGPFGFWL